MPARWKAFWTSPWTAPRRGDHAEPAVPNAMEFGPGRPAVLPVMDANEIWRARDDGRPRRRLRRCRDRTGVPGLGQVPDADGFIVSTQVFSGQVLRIDPRTGRKPFWPSWIRPGQLHVRRRSAVRVQLLRRDHRNPRVTADPVLLPGGSTGPGPRHRRRRRALHRRRALPPPVGRRQRGHRDVVHPGIRLHRGLVASGPGEFVVVTTPTGVPATAPRPANTTFWPTVSTSSTASTWPPTVHPCGRTGHRPRAVIVRPGTER